METFTGLEIFFLSDLKISADAIGLDRYRLSYAAVNKTFGFTLVFPSLGLGGRCIANELFFWIGRLKKMVRSVKLVTSVEHSTLQCLLGLVGRQIFI